MSIRKLVFFGVVTTALACSLNAQIPSAVNSPLVLWQTRVGGTDQDAAAAVVTLDDGSIVVSGTSRSTDGSVTQHHGDAERGDFWIVCLDAFGVVRWQRSLGGSSYEEAHAMVRTSDGNIVVAGESRSNDGDVTGHHGSEDFADAWIVKINVSGAIMWQHSLGGSDFDAAYGLAATNDGGVFVVGASNSNDGDVTGHHGASEITDGWIARLDGNGTLQWQQSLGGSDNEELRAAVVTSDGGVIAAGTSSSSDGDVPMNRGGDDLWIVRLDAAGALIWSRTAGGSQNDGAASVAVRSNGQIAAGGYSFSDDGDVHGHHGTMGFSDAWIATFNSDGTFFSEHSYGGSRNDAAQSLVKRDGGFAVAGWSESHDGDIVGHHGGIASDMWLFGTDAADTIIWSVSFGSNDREVASGTAALDNGKFVVVGSATHFNPSSEHHDNEDYLIVTIGVPTIVNPPIVSVPHIAAYPNPFSSTTTIHIPDDVHCAPGGVLIVTDMLGREVKRMTTIVGNDIVLSREGLREGEFVFRLYSNATVCGEGRVVVR